MSNIQRVNQILDDYLYGKIPVQNMRQVYKEQLEPAYKNLSYRNQDKVFYESDKLRGDIDAKGSVSFIRKYPELDGLESYSSPQEMLLQYGEHMPAHQVEILQNYKTPTRDLIRLNRAFQDYSSSPEGSRLFLNTPLSDHRRDAYEKMGFQGSKTQYLDMRPYQDQELFNKLYAIGDLNTYGLPAAELNLNQRIERNKLPSGSRVANLKLILPEINYKTRDYNENTPTYYDDYGYVPTSRQIVDEDVPF